MYQKQCDNCGGIMGNVYPGVINYCSNCGGPLKNSALLQVDAKKSGDSMQAADAKRKQEGQKQEKKKKDDLGNTIDQIKNLKEYRGED